MVGGEDEASGDPPDPSFSVSSSSTSSWGTSSSGGCDMLKGTSGSLEEANESLNEGSTTYG